MNAIEIALVVVEVLSVGVTAYCLRHAERDPREELERLARLEQLRREARRLEARSEARAAWRRARAFGNAVVEWRERGLV